jgi:hypothetical protein
MLFSNEKDDTRKAVLSNKDGVNLYVGNGSDANGTWVPVSWFGVEKNTLDEYKIY